MPSSPLRRLAAVVVAASLLVVANPVDAQKSASEARREREKVREERAAKAKSLEPLVAEDKELEAAVADMRNQVGAQQAKADDAARAVTDAQAELDMLTVDIAALGVEVERLEGLAQARAVEMYVGSGTSDPLDDLISSRDFDEAAKRSALAGEVQAQEDDVLDQLDARTEALRAARVAAERTRAELQRRKEAQDARLAELRDSQAELERLEADLQHRIDGLHSEIAGLEKDEKRLTALLVQYSTPRPSSFGAGSITLDPTQRPPSSHGLIYPVGGPITSRFGMRWGRMHKGIDISAPTGTLIHAAQSGTVIYAGWSGGYGNNVVIDHGNGFATLYAHQSRLGSSVGDRVSRGEVIGYVGSTGHSTGPHVHFETRINGTAYNPLQFL